MKVLVLGASGFVGHALFELLESDSNFDVIGTKSKASSRGNYQVLDLLNNNQVSDFFKSHRFDVIINCVGIKNVRQCEEQPDLAKAINLGSVENLIGCLNEHAQHPRVIYISTDYVFDGDSGPYLDQDMPAPKSVYGETKLLAEKHLETYQGNALIVRACALMHPRGAFLGWLLNELAETGKIEMFSDLHFGPTPLVPFLRRVIEEVHTEREDRPVVHACSEKTYSRYDFAKMIGSLTDAQKEIVGVRAGTDIVLPRHSTLNPSSNWEIPSNWREILKEN